MDDTGRDCRLEQVLLMESYKCVPDYCKLSDDLSGCLACGALFHCVTFILKITIAIYYDQDNILAFRIAEYCSMCQFWQLRTFPDSTFQYYLGKQDFACALKNKSVNVSFGASPSSPSCLYLTDKVQHTLQNDKHKTSYCLLSFFWCEMLPVGFRFMHFHKFHKKAELFVLDWLL